MENKKKDNRGRKGKSEKLAMQLKTYSQSMEDYGLLVPQNKIQGKVKGLQDRTMTPTQVRNQCLKELILMGRPKTDVIEYLMGEWDMGEKPAQMLINEQCREIKELMKSKDLVKKIRDKNITRLEAVIEHSYYNGRMADCIRAIEVQNRMFGLDNYNVNMNGELHNNLVFKVEIDGETTIADNGIDKNNVEDAEIVDEDSITQTN